MLDISTSRQEREQMVELVFQDWISWVIGFYWGGCGQKLNQKDRNRETQATCRICLYFYKIESN